MEIDTMLFGQPPNKAGDGINNFLILDIQDTYDPENGDKAFVAGYFFPNDQSDGDKGNRMNLQYIDTFRGFYFCPGRNSCRRRGYLEPLQHPGERVVEYRQRFAGTAKSSTIH